MEVFVIDYEMNNGNSKRVGILSKDKGRALSFLGFKVPTIRKIISIKATNAPVHAVDDEVLDYWVNNSERLQDYKKRIRELNNLVKEYENYTQELREELENAQQWTPQEQTSQKQEQILSSKEIRDQLREKGVLKPGSEKVKQYKENQVYLQTQEDQTETHKCPYCSFKGKTSKGLKTHISRKHRKKKI